MNKNIILKITCLLAIVLFVGTIGAGIGQADNLTFQLGVRNGVVPVGEFRADVNGVDVSFDWSAMVTAESYTMAVALSDEFGDPDMGSLALLDMGKRKTFSTSGLPSGMIFYAAILANTEQGPVVSNTLKFMPFAGVTTYPESGAVLMQLSDPGGIGALTIYGNRNGEDVNITRITGNDGTGLFVLTFVGDELTSFAKGDLTIDFSGLARSAETPLKMSSPAELAECQARVDKKGRAIVDEFVKKRDGIDSAILLLNKAKEAVTEDKFQLGGGIGYIYLDDLSKKIAKKISKLKKKKNDLTEEYKRDNANLIEEYEECSKDPGDPGGGIIDLSCPVPDGAEYNEIHYSNSTVKQYLLNGEIVGPWRWWGLDEVLKSEACKNAAGQLNGWAVDYYENGTMASAVHYKDGVQDGHDFVFYCSNGAVWRDSTYVNGTCTYSKFYYEDGSLSGYCDVAGDGIAHVVGTQTFHSPDCE